MSTLRQTFNVIFTSLMHIFMVLCGGFSPGEGGGGFLTMGRGGALCPRATYMYRHTKLHKHVTYTLLLCFKYEIKSFNKCSTRYLSVKKNSQYLTGHEQIFRV